MKILLYLGPRKKPDVVEERIYRNLRLMIEILGFEYTNNSEDIFDVAHFISVNDIDVINKVRELQIPIVFSGLNDTKTIKVQVAKEGNKLPGSLKTAISKVNMVIVPSDEIEKILIENKVETPSKVLSPGISYKLFDKMTELEKTSFLKYAGLQESDRFCVGMISPKYIEDLENYSLIASKFPRLQFYLFGEKPKRSFFKRKINKVLDSLPSNLHLKGNVDEDLFKSALVYSQAFLILSERYVSVETILEAMITNCQIITFKSKIYNEILIDNVTSINVETMEEMVEKVANINDNSIVDLKNTVNDFLEKHLLDNIALKLKEIYENVVIEKEKIEK